MRSTIWTSTLVLIIFPFRCPTKTHSEEKIADVVRNVDGNAHVREMEPIAESYQSDRDNMVRHKLPEVFPPLLLAQHHDHDLLHPKGGLKQIIEFEDSPVGLVRVELVHAVRLKVPEPRGDFHDVEAERPDEGNVACRVHLLHEARLLASRFDTAAAGQWPEELLHDELSREGQKDGVKTHKGDVPRAFAILRWW